MWTSNLPWSPWLFFRLYFLRRIRQKAQEKEKHLRGDKLTKRWRLSERRMLWRLRTNKRKNLLTAASSPETYTRSDFVTLKFPASWVSGTKRKWLKSWGEETAVVYEAYLLRVKHYADGMESCNCNLKEDVNNDFHLVTAHKKTKPEDDSITGEITPSRLLKN
jgi:hypothetical protein